MPSSTKGKLSVDVVSPRELIEQLRKDTGAFLPERRRIVGLSVLAGGAMGLIALYQTGLLRHLPDPPLPYFNSDKVDASEEAYAWLSTPDGVLGLASYAGTAVLAAMGGKNRARRQPWIPLALAAKVSGDALQAARLTRSQWTNHRAFCIWCLTAAGATFATLPPAFREARAALRSLLEQ